MTEVDTRVRNLLASKPEVGDVLTSKDGESVPVTIDVRPDSGKGVTEVWFVNACVDPEGTGWYLSSVSRGLKILISLTSQDVLREKFGQNLITVVSLKVVRKTPKGTALIAELA
jgi:hypothetical protein